MRQILKEEKRTKEKNSNNDHQLLYRHGDLLIKRISKLPPNVKPTNNTVLAEGEVTGHRHQLVGQRVQVYENAEGQKYFTIGQSSSPAELVHEEHKKIEIEEGVYVVVQEREFNPFEEAIRRVAD